MVDPFLTKNPATPTDLKDLARYHPGYVLVTHSHGDHLGDAIELAKISQGEACQRGHAGGFQEGRAAAGIV